MLKISFRESPEIVNILRRKPISVKAVLLTKINALLLQLEAKIKGKLSGDVLKVRSGILRGSVHAVPAELRGNRVIAGAVESSGGPAFYGSVHEYGGTHAYPIFATKARALSFLMEPYGRVYMKSVVHPALPKRPFMGPSAAEWFPDAVEQMRAALDEEMSKDE